MPCHVSGVLTLNSTDDSSDGPQGPCDQHLTTKKQRKKKLHTRRQGPFREIPVDVRPTMGQWLRHIMPIFGVSMLN